MTWNELHDLIETMSAGEREKSAVVFDAGRASFFRVESCDEFDPANEPGVDFSMSIDTRERWY